MWRLNDSVFFSTSTANVNVHLVPMQLLYYNSKLLPKLKQCNGERSPQHQRGSCAGMVLVRCGCLQGHGGGTTGMWAAGDVLGRLLGGFCKHTVLRGGVSSIHSTNACLLQKVVGLQLWLCGAGVSVVSEAQTMGCFVLITTEN